MKSSTSSVITSIGILNIFLLISCAAFSLPKHEKTHPSCFSSSTLASKGSSIRSSSSLEAARKEICIVGGGFGGLNAALTLSSLPFPPDQKPTITLIDKKERFVFLPLLYELCVGDADINEVAPTYRSMLKGTDIKFKQATVDGIDAESNTVFLDGGGGGQQKISYDSLIVATGADVNLEPIPGAQSLALPFYTISDCLELRKRLKLLDSLADDIDRQLEVVVVGGSYSGVELALNVKERLDLLKKGVKVTVIHRGKEVLNYAAEYNQKTGLDRLQKSGVEIRTDTSVVQVMDRDGDGDDVHEQSDIADLNGRARVLVEKDSVQQTLNADILLWTAGAMRTNVQKGILNSKLPRDASGRLVTDKYLAVKGCDNVFALGDCSRVKKVPYGATAAVAMQQAPFAAWNVYSSIMMDAGAREADQKLKPLPFSYLDLGEMLTLGGEDASISSLGLVEASGPAASVLRRLIYAVRMPTTQQALTAAISSATKRFEALLVSSSRNAKSGDKGGKKIINWKQ